MDKKVERFCKHCGILIQHGRVRKDSKLCKECRKGNKKVYKRQNEEQRYW